ncbi:MAG: ABC transporter permease, partial [Planctomycetes bacterium]|nr:ABC transporter permease [Planctomycetota bacterium]
MSPIAASPKPFILIRLLDQWGDLWVRTFTLIGGVSYLLYDVLIWVLRGLFTSKVRFGRAAIITQVVRIGIHSIGIVVLVCGSIGFILALQMAPPLGDFGQTDKIANIVG